MNWGSPDVGYSLTIIYVLKEKNKDFVWFARICDKNKINWIKLTKKDDWAYNANNMNTSLRMQFPYPTKDQL